MSHENEHGRQNDQQRGNDDDGPENLLVFFGIGCDGLRAERFNCRWQWWLSGAVKSRHGLPATGYSVLLGYL